jgi:5-methylcytosine-specific restriction protein B
VPFYVPKNVHLVGMMNTADRSLAMIDYALRRRFSFFDIAPGFDSDGFKRIQQSLKSVSFDNVVEILKRLNHEIANDPSLGKGFCIGHSYLCDPACGMDDCLKNVIEFDILPMLAEYWFDEMDKYERWAKALMDVFQ